MTEQTKCPEFHCKLAANHVGPHICATWNCVANPRPAQDYNEMLISQAGGDGDAELVSIRIERTRASVETVSFTNVPMDRVHAAIALLNDEPQNTPPLPCGDFHCSLPANHPGPHQCGMGDCAVNPPIAFPHPPEPGHIRTEDFTEDELFGEQTGVLPDTREYECAECGAIIYNRAKHVTWHNKTLP
jgi:hypothetical protein